MRIRSGAITVVLAVLLAVLLAGCSTLPTSGPVSTEPGTSADGAQQAPDFVPPGPSAGASKEAVVRGFLLAAQANPPSTSVARSFLSERARNTWTPEGALVYSTATLEPEAESVVAHLSGAHVIDRRGSWQGTEEPRAENLELDLVSEQGEWRIENPPTALPIPVSYFRSTYDPYLLYFFDRTTSVLVPSRVYLPRGEQVASSLVRGLLAGPPQRQSAVAVSAFGTGIDLDLSVVIGEDGTAEIPLSSAFARLPRADLYRAAVQLSATLRQLSGVVGLRVTVGGVAVPLVNGQTDVSRDLAPELDPVALPERDVVALTEGRVVRDGGAEAGGVAGPFGVAGFALRSVASHARELAGVARNGRRAYLAPAEGSRRASRVRIVLDGASNLLRPVFDRFGNLWLLDAAPGGAVVHVVRDGRSRIVTVAGVSGRRISTFTVTRDGASLVAGRDGGTTPTVLVSPVVRTLAGTPVRGTTAQRVPVPDADLTAIIGLAQSSATAVAVLVTSEQRGSRVLSVELDGSPGTTAGPGLPTVPGVPRAVLADPAGDRPTLVLLADGQLLRPSSPTGDWAAMLTGVSDAAYPQ